MQLTIRWKTRQKVILTCYQLTKNVQSLSSITMKVDAERLTGAVNVNIFSPSVGDEVAWKASVSSAISSGNSVNMNSKLKFVLLEEMMVQ